VALKPKPLSLRAYAAHRKGLGLPGGSLQAVQRAIAGGRLARSVVDVAGVKRIADPKAADREWAANTDLSRAPDKVKAQAAAAATVTELEPQAHGGALKRTRAIDEDEHAAEDDDAPTMARWSAEEKQWRAKMAELRYRERAGELVEAAGMQAAMADAYSEVRSKLLGVPSKAKQRLAHLTLEDFATLEEIVREALEAIAGDENLS
jgi:phage terminase Nu1 subunit (DNA packaging protein)